MAILFSALDSLNTNPNDDSKQDSLSKQIKASMESLAIIMLWFKAFYYLRIWDETNYLARMVLQVVKDMSVFGIVYSISHFGAGQGFLIISMSSSEDY